MSNSTQTQGNPSQPLGDHNSQANKLYLYAGTDSEAQEIRHFTIMWSKSFKHETETEGFCSCGMYYIQHGGLANATPKKRFTVDFIGIVDAHDKDEMTEVLLRRDKVLKDFADGYRSLDNARSFLCMYLSFKQLLNLHEWGQVEWNPTNLKKVVDAYKAYESHLLTKSAGPTSLLRLNDSKMVSSLQDMINELEKSGVLTNLPKKLSRMVLLPS